MAAKKRSPAAATRAFTQALEEIVRGKNQVELLDRARAESSKKLHIQFTSTVNAQQIASFLLSAFDYGRGVPSELDARKLSQMAAVLTERQMSVHETVVRAKLLVDHFKAQVAGVAADDRQVAEEFFWRLMLLMGPKTAAPHGPGDQLLPMAAELDFLDALLRGRRTNDKIVALLCIRFGWLGANPSSDVESTWRRLKTAAANLPSKSRAEKK